MHHRETLTRRINLTMVLMHTPPPEGEACGQWITALGAEVLATPIWYRRHPKVSPLVSAAVPIGKRAHDVRHASLEANVDGHVFISF